MYSKFIGLFFLIAAFMAVSSLAGFLEYTPMKYSQSKLVYDLAERAIKHYNKQKHRKPHDRVDLCVVKTALHKQKRVDLYRVYMATFKPRCLKIADNDCYPTLMAEIVKTRPTKYKVSYVQPVKAFNSGYYTDCHFPE